MQAKVVVPGLKWTTSPAIFLIRSSLKEPVRISGAYNGYNVQGWMPVMLHVFEAANSGVVLCMKGAFAPCPECRAIIFPHCSSITGPTVFGIISMASSASVPLNGIINDFTRCAGVSSSFRSSFIGVLTNTFTTSSSYLQSHTYIFWRRLPFKRPDSVVLLGDIGHELH